MSIRKDVTVKITNNNATLDMPLQIYELDHGIELRFKLMDYKYKYTKDPQNILNSSDEDILEAYTTIINPRGYELQQINGEVKDDIVVFMIDSSYTDEIDEVGIYSLQIHIKCACSEFSIPPIQFEVLQRLKGIKVVTDGEDSIDDSALIDNYSNFVSDETGKLLIEWKKGDIISSVKLNAMVEVINNAVDEEVQRQLNEVKREQQELERQNKVREALNSVDARVDEAMNEYETRFNALTVSQQQDMEVIDARDGEISLKARLDRDVKKPLQVYEDVEGSYISCDSTAGYAKNVEILGNTIQDQNNLADIRSVGDKIEGRELYEIDIVSCGKNLFDVNKVVELYSDIQLKDATITLDGKVRDITNVIKFKPNTEYTISYNRKRISGEGYIGFRVEYTDGSSVNMIGSAGFSKFTFGKDRTISCFKFTFTNGCTCELSDIQLEEGSVATPYEPYQEDKLTILSTIQLEKVGDVADRIVYNEKLQTWGVEKNVGNIVFKGTEKIIPYMGTDNTKLNCNVLLVSINYAEYKIKRSSELGNVMSSKFKHKVNSWIIDEPNIFTTHSNTSVNHIYFNAPKDIDESMFKEYIKDVIIKYQLTESTFIPLPHDQQIKLRTFANKTNISFGCEIEPTLKASVPKSIGASVNGHLEQIDNLGKEIDKIKKLEGSATSEVVTESDFTTVEETSKGYFEDVKLEGRTLVNLYENKQKIFNTKYIYSNDEKINLSLFKPDTVYTSIILDETGRIDSTSLSDRTSVIGIYRKVKDKIFTFKTPSDFSNLSSVDIRIYAYPLSDDNGFIEGDENKIKYVILEGDHTQNPPEFFKGIKSVGQDVDEISVSSCNGNLFNADDVVSDYSGYYKCDEYIVYQNGAQRTYLKQDFEPNTQYSFTFKASSDKAKPILFSCRYTDGTYKNFELKNSESNKINTSSFTSAEGKSIKEICSFYSDHEIITLYLDGTCMNKGTTPIPYTPYKENKKRILYYNDETQTWEKPVLREWDSIDKHSDGKYYYHKRSGEVVFNGSESWLDRSTAYVSDTQTRFSIEHSVKPCSIGVISLICDKYPAIGTIPAVTSVYGNGINHHITGSTIYITVPKTTLEEFKATLQSNPVTVVYQLAEEKVYECTDLDLITYLNETNLMVKGGTIVPKTTLKVRQNIANITTILQEKVSVLENNVGHVTEIFVNSKIEPINNEIGNINADLFGISESIEGSYVSVVSKDGYLKDVEIIGNTIQDQNDLADIRSVGDKLENQELYEIPVVSCGKNLININSKDIKISVSDGKDKVVYTIEDNFLVVKSNGSYDWSFVTLNNIKVKPNTTYTLTPNATVVKGNVSVWVYDNSNNKLFEMANSSKTFTTNNLTTSVSIRFYCQTTTTYTDACIKYKAQLEEGTVATPYEPYVEDKLTILSPVQLDKIGNVVNRIICKDGVWGVEKNINSKFLTGEDIVNSNWQKNENITGCLFKHEDEYLAKSHEIKVISSIIPSKGYIDIYNKDVVGISLYENTMYGVVLKISNSTLNGLTAVEYFNQNPLYVKYQLAQTQFIPLPHDQQIKLRTFTNKTNIHFLTEIEPTLKASVPKSLNATVSTHTEQIDNLGKEIDKVKKLEESTVSTFTTESSFTTVTETSNGYFEDVKLEGRTLVNLATLDKTVIGRNMESTASQYIDYILKNGQYTIDKNKEYTFIINISQCPNDRLVRANHFGAVADIAFPLMTLGSGVGTYIYKTKPKDNMEFTRNSNFLTIGCEAGSLGYFECSVVIIEGDHTQNPPEFFKGIKSVGQDVDEISVSSCNENLFNADDVVSACPQFYKCNEYIQYTASGAATILKDDFEHDTVYTFTIKASSNRSADTIIINFLCEYTDGTSEVFSMGHYKPNTVHIETFTSTRGKTIKRLKNSHNAGELITLYLDGTSIIKGEQSKPYKPHKQDKKPLLYYNPTTETWEKPVLREWDSIEKHSDGKYYYHKRSDEVVLNGSEDWGIRTDVTDDGVHSGFSLNTSFKYNKTSSYMICNRFNAMPFGSAAQAYSNGEGIGYYIANDSNYIMYCVLPKTKLSSQDLTGFKAWLQANPATIVYQLEKEEVYECTSIDLMTYKNETNFIVNAGPIAPVSTLKVMCNINNVVRELQQKVSNLENYIQHVMIDALNNALNE